MTLFAVRKLCYQSFGGRFLDSAALAYDTCLADHGTIAARLFPLAVYVRVLCPHPVASHRCHELLPTDQPPFSHTYRSAEMAFAYWQVHRHPAWRADDVRRRAFYAPL